MVLPGICRDHDCRAGRDADCTRGKKRQQIDRSDHSFGLEALKISKFYQLGRSYYPSFGLEALKISKFLVFKSKFPRNSSPVPALNSSPSMSPDSVWLTQIGRVTFWRKFRSDPSFENFKVLSRKCSVPPEQHPSYVLRAIFGPAKPSGGDNTSW